MPNNKAVFRKASDCETESWRDGVSGHVDWWTLFSADRTATSGLTVGVAEIPVGAPRPPQGHTHEQAEVYFFLSGAGEVEVDGESTPVVAGDAVFIPSNIEHMSVNTGSEPLRLLYFFAADSFTDIVYKFPGATP
jgi:mannose-6-phosphate isomerase-like protein (cupin superfamily)